MSMYEASLSYGLKFDPKAALRSHVKMVKAVVETRKKYDPDSGERLDDQKAVKEPARLVVNILGKEFVFVNEDELGDGTKFNDLDDDLVLSDFYDEIFAFVAKKVGGGYGRGSEACEESGQPSAVEHFFMISGDRRELTWVAKTALPALLRMQQKLKKIGIKVGNPRIIFSCTKA